MQARHKQRPLMNRASRLAFALMLAPVPKLDVDCQGTRCDGIFLASLFSAAVGLALLVWTPRTQALDEPRKI